MQPAETDALAEGDVVDSFEVLNNSSDDDGAIGGGGAGVAASAAAAAVSGLVGGGDPEMDMPVASVAGVGGAAAKRPRNDTDSGASGGVSADGDNAAKARMLSKKPRSAYGTCVPQLCARSPASRTAAASCCAGPRIKFVESEVKYLDTYVHDILKRYGGMSCWRQQRHRAMSTIGAVWR
jgi:hypothetical protein